MKVVHIAFECAPIYKTGGLGDVVGSLPKVLQAQGIETIILLPAYSFTKHPRVLPGSKVPIFYVPGDYFTKEALANSQFVPRAFAQFCVNALEKLKEIDFKPDIIHCHDWHSALVPWLLDLRPDGFFKATKTILTIHNIAYQGKFSKENLDVPATKLVYDLFSPHRKRVSFIKAGIKHADFITTVSPEHAKEIKAGKVVFGLHSILKKKRGAFIGILNGIDYSVWNPRHDPLIARRYGKSTVFAGKTANKEALQKRCHLPVAQVPVFGFIARLVKQKGIELLVELVKTAAEKRIQIVILGSGEAKYERLLESFRLKYPDWIAFSKKFDEPLAHLIYAGVDFIFIPSLYEPCGLTQMIGMAYGTSPIAASVGGLVDTIKDKRTGFLFNKGETAQMLGTVDHALVVVAQKASQQDLIKRLFQQDFSWDRSARAYGKLYRKLVEKK